MRPRLVLRRAVRNQLSILSTGVNVYLKELVPCVSLTVDCLRFWEDQLCSPMRKQFIMSNKFCICDRVSNM